MKPLNSTLLFALAVALLMFFSCKDNSTGPEPPEEHEDPTEEPVDPPSSDHFNFESGKATETEDGFKFEGKLIGRNKDRKEFVIGEGEFSVVLNEDSVVVSITGTGLPEFPDIGIFKEMLKDFAWDKVKSHIIYKRGNYFLDEFDTEVPLNPDRYYLTYQIFDKESGDKYKLKGIGNSIVYSFNEIYIDIEDPAIFLKFQLWKPKKAVKSVAEKFWGKVKEAAKAVGQNLKDYAGAPGMIVGISNNGTFLTPSYEPGSENSQVFEKLYGFSGLSQESANQYLGLRGVPIPSTAILSLNGNLFMHNPLTGSGAVGDVNSVLDWWNRVKTTPVNFSFEGNIDFGGKGVAFVLTGILPAINEITGRDIFSEDINLVLTQAFYQANFSPHNDGFFRMGGYLDIPMLLELFGPKIKEFIVPGGDATDRAIYGFFNVPSEVSKASYFFEGNYTYIVPNLKEMELYGYFLINNEGITFHADEEIVIGPFTVNEQIEGKVNKNGYDLHTGYEGVITLPTTELELFSEQMNITISSDSGVTLNGKVTLPLVNIETSVQGRYTQADGLALRGNDNIGSISFDGVVLSTNNSAVTIDDGIFVSGIFMLPGGLKTADMEGSITSDEMRLTGKMGTNVTLDGHTFQISNSSISASTKTGVNASFDINLYQFTSTVSGPIEPGGTFELIGSNGFRRGINFAGQSATLEGTITVHVTHTGINLSGSGTVTYTGALGNTHELYSGPLSFNPNWSARTIEVCASDYCTNI